MTYVPDHAVSMIPTRIRTEIRLSSAPARDADRADADERPVQDRAGAARRDAARMDANDDARDWPLLCGEVVDGSGTPVGGARVELESPRLAVSTDMSGRFCVACPAGDRSLRIETASRGRATRTVALQGRLVELRITLSQ